MAREFVPRWNSFEWNLAKRKSSFELTFRNQIDRVISRVIVRVNNVICFRGIKIKNLQTDFATNVTAEYAIYAAATTIALTSKSFDRMSSYNFYPFVKYLIFSFCDYASFCNDVALIITVNYQVIKKAFSCVNWLLKLFKI